MTSAEWTTWHAKRSEPHRMPTPHREEPTLSIGGGVLIVATAAGLALFLLLSLLALLMQSVPLFYGMLALSTPVAILLALGLALGLFLAVADLATDAAVRTRRNAAVVLTGFVVLVAAVMYLGVVLWSHGSL